MDTVKKVADIAGDIVSLLAGLLVGMSVLVGSCGKDDCCGNQNTPIETRKAP